MFLNCRHILKFVFRAEVKSIPGSTDKTVHESELRNTQNMQETGHLLFTSCCTSTKTNMWTDKELDENAKELYKLLKSCKYAKQSLKSAVSIDNETSYHVANNMQSCSCACEDNCSCGITLDMQEFLKDNKQFEGEELIHNTIKQHMILVLFLKYTPFRCVCC